MKVARINLHLRDYPRGGAARRCSCAGRTALRGRGEAARRPARALTFVRPNVLGVAVPLSGNYKRWGDAILQGVSLALEGSGVKVAVRDTRGEPAGTAAAIEALVLEEGAIAVVGGVTNAEGEPAAAAAEELQIPLLSLEAGGHHAGRPVRVPEHAHRERAGRGAHRPRHGQARDVALRDPLPVHAVRRGARERLLGRARGARRRGAPPRPTRPIGPCSRRS